MTSLWSTDGNEKKKKTVNLQWKILTNCLSQMITNSINSVKLIPYTYDKNGTLLLCLSLQNM